MSMDELKRIKEQIEAVVHDHGFTVRYESQGNDVIVGVDGKVMPGIMGFTLEKQPDGTYKASGFESFSGHGDMIAQDLPFLHKINH